MPEADHARALGLLPLRSGRRLARQRGPAALDARCVRDHEGAPGLRDLRTGGTLSTTDLWYQGVIPERFRAQLPDTHEFVPRPERDIDAELERAGPGRSL